MPTSSDVKTMPMPRDEFKSMLGEGFHTAFRKATDCPQAHPIWKGIQEMPPEAWESVLEYVTWGFEVSYGVDWSEDAAEDAGRECAKHMEYAVVMDPPNGKVVVWRGRSEEKGREEAKAFGGTLVHRPVGEWSE